MSQTSGNGTRRTLTAEQKRRILEKRRKQKLKKRLMIIAPIAVVVLAVLIVLLVNVGQDAKQEKLAREEAILQATIEANKTPTPAPTPTATPVPEAFNYDEAYVAAARGEQNAPLITPDYSKVDPMKMDRWPETKEGFMPVLYKAETTDNIIAVTVDDCFQANNLRQIVQCALDNNADLTIFPIGKNLETQAIADVVKWAYENGMEIENHTYNHAGMYHYDDERMMNELWYQNAKVSEVLGHNHQMHFFRPKGGDERDDQRVHAYINQIGYNAIAMWSQSGSRDSLDSLYRNLAPGRIYLFHTTNNDLNKLLEFIPGAIARGYRLVTLNEMFGLPDNEKKDISTVGEKPAFKSFKVAPAKLKKTSYIRAAAVVQKRLIELGWMEGEADGVYGQSSFIAIGFFQMANNMTPTGVADAETQMALFADDAVKGSPEKIAEFMKQLGK